MVIEDPIERWRGADVAWVREHAKVLDVVYQWFLREHEWPAVSDLRRYLAQHNVTSLDVQAAADARPLVPVQAVPARREHISLGVRHLLLLPDAHWLLNLVVELTQAAVAAYKSPMDPPSVARADLVDPGQPGATNCSTSCRTSSTPTIRTPSVAATTAETGASSLTKP